MAKKTKTEKIIDIIMSRGCVEVIPSKSRKYRQFSILASKEFYWIGKAGACRRGLTSSSSMAQYIMV